MANNFDGMFADLLPQNNAQGASPIPTPTQAPAQGAVPVAAPAPVPALAAPQGKFDSLFADLLPANARAAATAQSVAQLGKPSTGPQVSNIAAKGDLGSDPSMFNSETAMDMLKGAGAGLEKGVTGMLGGPRDFSNLTQAGVEKLSTMLGGTPQQAQTAGSAVAALNPFSYLAGSDTLNKGVEGIQGSPIYQAKTTPGQYADSIGQMVPSVMMGPGGVARKGIMAAAEGAASQAAGDIPGIKDTALEPLARGAATLAAGIPAATIGSGTNALKSVIANAPAQSEVKAAKDALYGALQKSDVNYDTNAFHQTASDIGGALSNFRAAQAPLGLDALKAVTERVGQPMNFTDFDSLRQNVGSIMREPSATNQDKAVASIIMEHLNNFEKTAPLSTNGLIPADQVQAVAAQARELARRNIITNQLNEFDRKAPGYVAGTDSAVKNQAGSYLKSQKGNGLSDMEGDAFEKMVSREGLANVASTGGSRLAMAAGHSVGPIIGGALGSMFGPVGTAVGAGLGGLASTATHLGLRALANSSAQTSLNNARSIVLAGRGAQGAATANAAANTTSRNLRAIASGMQGADQGLAQSGPAPAF